MDPCFGTIWPRSLLARRSASPIVNLSGNQYYRIGKAGFMYHEIKEFQLRGKAPVDELFDFATSVIHTFQLKNDQQEPASGTILLPFTILARMFAICRTHKLDTPNVLLCRMHCPAQALPCRSISRSHALILPRCLCPYEGLNIFTPFQVSSFGS